LRNADSVFRGAAEEEEASDAFVSRLGGDEFTVLLVKLRNENESAIVARRILATLEEPFTLDGQQVYISASIGIALYPQDVEDVGSLLKNADLAMYSAKDRGKNNYQFFRESMNSEIVHRTTVAAELRDARNRREFEVYYQPIVHARSHEIVGLEALIRWNHPTRGLVLPGEFIEIAENSGLIVSISDQIVAESCEQVRRWREAGLPPVRLAVNISGVQLRAGDYSARLSRILSETGLPADSLELEITENAVMEDEAEAGRSLDELKALGLRISLDDFGTGYSSLSYLQRYPVDCLKVDYSFVRNVASDPEAQAITTAIVAMAHGLELEVVAEGVETEAQELFLQGLGCDFLQGFRFSTPRPADEIDELLASGTLSGTG
jgi:predicted signal transduction protein with EAL and GGDEF domain